MVKGNSNMTQHHGVSLKFKKQDSFFTLLKQTPMFSIETHTVNVKAAMLGWRNLLQEARKHMCTTFLMSHFSSSLNLYFLSH